MPEKCFYCNVELIPPPRPPNGHSYPKRFQFPSNMASWDHVLAKALGGKDDHVVRACFKCNQLKGLLSLDEFRTVIALRASIIPVPAWKFPGEQTCSKNATDS